MDHSSASPSCQTHSRKRKKCCSQSSTSIGILTRSRAQIHSHRNRSGIARPDPNPSKAVSGVVLLEVNCKNNNKKNNPSRISSIKDLRTRRVFTPDVCSIVQEEREDESLKGEDPGPDSGTMLECELGDRKVDKIERSNEVTLNGGDNGVNLNDQPNSGNGSIPKSKMALNMCGRRKVFKSPSSFSYRRLLPYLMDISKSDSGTPEIEIMDARISRKLQKMDGADDELYSVSGNSCTAKVEQSVSQSNVTKPLEGDDVPKFDTAENELGHEKEQNTRQAEVEQRGHEKGASTIAALVDEECGQATPPDANIFIQMRANRGGNDIEAKNEPVENQLGQSPNGKLRTDPINGMVLNPCSRLRVFKNPTSVSYRRLLPFLMDISKQNSCPSTIIQQSKFMVDLKDVHPSATTTEQDYVNKTATERCEKNLTEDCSSPDTGSNLGSSNVVPSTLTSETDSQNEAVPQSESSPINLGQDFHSEENNSPSPQSFTITMGSEVCKNGESGEKVNLKQNSFQTEDSDAPLMNGPSKGILKRTPRGCRGLCNCLNCASFRLHAERAFEFSRNQMHDAEEVTSDLMKELANIRLLLEKSIINENGLAIIQNPVQVKQACNKAMETENLAKERLSQMNYDLNIHCRIPSLQQPQVTFAHRIKETTLPMLDPSTSA